MITLKLYMATEGIELFMEKNPNFKHLKELRREKGLKLYNRKCEKRTEEDDKDYIKKIKLEWQRNNKDYYNQLVKLSYYKNRDKRLAKNKEKVQCSWCNKTYQYGSLHGHKKICKDKPSLDSP